MAIKLLPASATTDPERRERFEREAQAVAALNHPHIVTIHSVEQAEGQFFLTMELVEGRSLAEALPKGGLSLDRLLKIAIPVADAVAAAHHKGITHRDLKPANIMLGEGGAGRAREGARCGQRRPAKTFRDASTCSPAPLGGCGPGRVTEALTRLAL